MVAVLGKRLGLYLLGLCSTGRAREPDIASLGLLIYFFFILSPQLIFKEPSLPFIVIN